MMTYVERHQIMTQEVNISTSLMFGLGQAGADGKWTSDTTTNADVTELVTEPQPTDDGLSDLDDLYEYYSQVLR